jgi:photosystem II stability/assembly factor-like uncharacterized protein
MKITVKFMLFIGCLCSSSLRAQWEPIGPEGGDLRALARARSDETRIYAVSRTNPSHIVKSTNRGASWSSVTCVPDFIYSMTIDPTNPDIVYAGGCAKIFKSTDAGATWSYYSVSNFNIYNLAIHPTQPAVISAAGAVKIGLYYYLAYFRSTNAGLTWTSKQIVTNKKSCAYCLAIDPADPRTIYIGGSVLDSLKNPLLYKSVDAGVNFTDVSAGFAPCSTVRALAIHPVQTNIVYCGTDTGMYRSTDSGSSWSAAGVYGHVYSLATSAAEPNAVFAGADTAIYRSTDAGLSWIKTGPGLFGREFRSLAMSRTTASDIVAGNDVGFFTSGSGGSVWAASNHAMNINAVDNFTVSRSAPATIYAEISEVGEFKTVDAGAQWSLLPDFLSCGSICGIAAHNAQPDTVFALEGKG